MKALFTQLRFARSSFRMVKIYTDDQRLPFPCVATESRRLSTRMGGLSNDTE